MSESKLSNAERIQIQPLAEADPEMYALLVNEEKRQFMGLELIASENFTSKAVMDVLGSCLTNKYSEGLPGKRYYGGNEFIDQVENLCIKRALKAFNLDDQEWGVNVQPYSGSSANFAAYTAVIQPHDRIMGLDLPSGGHLTHGFYTAKKKISATSIYFESLPYEVDHETGLIAYDKLAETAKIFRPKVLVCGASAYPREWDYQRLRKIADDVGALMMMDMAHISGLVAAQVVENPFEFADIVTTTTHKSLRGPRAGLIFFKKTHPMGLENRINFSVFPSLQGGPHNNTIAGVAVQLKQVCTDEFKAYAKQVRTNCEVLGADLVKMGYKLCTGGTDNHLILWDLRPLGITGSKMESVCDAVHITLNKNSVHGDKSAFSPGGVRIGTPALTSRGFKEEDFSAVGKYLDRAVKIAVKLQDITIQVTGKKMLATFKLALAGKLDGVDEKVNEEIQAEVKALKEEVVGFASTFFMPGFAVDQYK